MLTGVRGGEIRHVEAGAALSDWAGMSPYAWWTHAVDVGGRGSVAAALTELDELGHAARSVMHRPSWSLAYSTAASLYRQGGRHARAHDLDGMALSVLARSVPGVGGVVARSDQPTTPAAIDAAWERAALLDALVNLAADNLGLARFQASARLLSRARSVTGDTAESGVGDTAESGTNDTAESGTNDTAESGTSDTAESGTSWLTWQTEIRPRLRLQWVATELALYTGDSAGAATHAASALRIVHQYRETSTRHRIKTELIAAASYGAAGAIDLAVAQARDLAGQAAAAGLIPLQWAALSLLSGLCPDAQVGVQLTQVQQSLSALGMPFAATAPNS